MAKYWDRFANEYVDEKDLEVTAPPERYHIVRDIPGTVQFLRDTIARAEEAIKILLDE